MTSRFALESIASFVLFAICTSACAKSHRAFDNVGKPIDQALVAYLSEARALHHKANLAEDARDVPGAIAALQELVNARHPTSPEVDEVLADTDARLAELELESKAPGASTRANQDVARGLARHASPYFRGHLLEVSGTVDEARAAELADAGQGDAAAQMRKQAAASLDEAVKIQAEVVQRALSTPNATGATSVTDGGS